MKISKAYLEFQVIVNENATNSNLVVDKTRFILLFNSTQIKYVEWLLNKRNEDKIRDINGLLVVGKTLKSVGSTTVYQEFELPADYFDNSSLRATASKGSCHKQPIQVREVKAENIDELFSDENQKPSFEWRDSFYTIASLKIQVYRENFNIDKASLNYYRYPKKVDIQGYLNEDGKQSTNKDPEFDDKVVQRILLAMAKDFAANNGDANKYQIDLSRTFSEV